MRKKIIAIALLLLPISSCYAFDMLNEMRRENDQRIDRMIDRVNEERYLMELRRANDEEKRVNRRTTENKKPKLFGY